MSAVASPDAIAANAGSERKQSAWPLALLMVASSAGLLVVGLAFDASRHGHDWGVPLLWAGLMVIVLPNTMRLLGAGASRGERLTIVIMLGLALYGVKLLQSPTGFTLHDELGHYRSVEDILRTGRLYVPNPLVPAYAFYPGVLSAAAAFSRLSGLGIVASGLIVIGFARLLLVGGLFLLVERLSKSPRIAALAVVVYAANPNFVFFDSEFAYESLAIGLAVMALWAVSRVADEERVPWTDVGIAAMLDCALVLTHHLTSYAFAIVTVLWFLVAAIRGRWRRNLGVGLLALFSIVITAAYAIYAFHATSSDIGGALTGSIHGLYEIVTGGSAGKTPFASAKGYSDPPLERGIGLISVVLLFAALPWGLYALVRRRPLDTGLLIIGSAAILYPFSLALRLSSAGSETSNRTSEFIFVGLGAVIALAFCTRNVALTTRFKFIRRTTILLATVYVGVIFAGGVVVGTPDYQVIPGSYEVAAGPRSIDQEGISAARWAGNEFRGEYKFLADGTDTGLLTAHTTLDPQKGNFGGRPIGAVFVDPAFGKLERSIVSADKLRFLVIDRRDSSALPHSGRYFDSADPQPSYADPIPLSSLLKFDGVSCIDRIFSSGNVVIFDAGRLLGGCK